MWTLTASPITSTSTVFATATPTRAVPKWNNVGYSDCIASLDATTPSESFALRKMSSVVSISESSIRSSSTTTTRKSLLNDSDSGYVSLRNITRRERRSNGSMSSTSSCHSRTCSSDSTLSRTSSVSSLASSTTTTSSRSSTSSITTIPSTKTPRRTPMTREMEADIRAGRIPDPAFGPYRAHTATQAERIDHLRILLKEAEYRLGPEIIAFSKQPVKKRSASEVFWDPREEDEEGEPEVEEKGVWERIRGFFV